MERTDVFELLRAARNGCEFSQNRLLDRFGTYLFSLAKKELPNGLRSKTGESDLVQITLKEAWQDLTAFEGSTESELRAWLKRILHNNAISIARHYRQTTKRDVGKELSLEEFQMHANLAATVETPSRALLEQERAEILEISLSQLPQQYREVILLHHKERRTFAEIATALGRAEGAVRKLWSRAIKRWQEEVSYHYGDLSR